MHKHNGKQIIGIIGGFGPEATADFYLKLVDTFRASHWGSQPDILIKNAPVPRKLEQDLLLFGKSRDKFAPLLIHAAHDLEAHGASRIVLPCNTLHVHEQAIRDAIHVPFISIIRETAESLRQQNVTRVGFLGSRITTSENLFQKEIRQTQFITVPSPLQRKIDRGLAHFVDTQDDRLLRAALKEAFDFFEKKEIRDVLVACTDFHGLCPTGMRIHDTLNILVQATVRQASK